MSAGFLVTMKGGFLGFSNKLVKEFPDARLFKRVSGAVSAAKVAANAHGLGGHQWEVMSVAAYDTGEKTTPRGDLVGKLGDKGSYPQGGAK